MKQTAVSRKDRIMAEARNLFAKKGYMDTTTKEIAENAKVSEALIFKHFGNKDKLLTHLIKSGYRRVLLFHKGMMVYKNPKSFLLNMIKLPHELVNEDPIFWKMQERLAHHSFSKQQHDAFMKPVRPILERAFKELGYEDPRLEADLLLLVIDALWKKEAVGDLVDSVRIAELLHEKYKLV